MTYGEFGRQVDALAGALADLGVMRGDRIVVDMQNTPQLVIAHLAILRANAVVVPVNPMNRAEEIKHYISDPAAKIAITTCDLAPELAQASNALPTEERLTHLIVSQFTDAFDPLDTDTPAMALAWRDWLLTTRPPPALDGGEVCAWTDLMARNSLPPEHTVGANDMALLPYTSGTTGLPKGCVHNHSSLMHNALATNLWFGMTCESVVLAVVPMFHITGIVAVMHAAIAAGAAMIVMPRWDRDVAGHLISRWKVTSWINIPTMIIDLMASPEFKRYDLSSLRCIAGGGAAMPQAVAQRLLEEFGLSYQEAYGLTETAGPSHSNPAAHAKQQCLGIPFMSVDARVVDPETLQELPQGQSGEIIIHGPQVFQGYWKRPDATADAFLEREGKRFFRSGDMGRVDDEGYFFITDRLKRMINASGFKVWPAEVELMMFKHPAIQEACIVSTRDPYRGESVKAVVVLRPAHERPEEEDIIAWCRKNMAAYKVPREVRFVDALPKSGSGKVMWRVLQQEEDQKG
jgi:fatty-acyl-CoA synthase